MKTSIFTVILSVLFASSLFGQVKVTPTLDQIMAQAKGLPALTNTNLKFKPAPRFASVQPTVDIKFSYTSCAAMGFRLNSFETKDRIFALIQLRNKIDCAGPRKTREYSLQIASDIVRKPVVVLNPVAYQFKASPIVMPRPDLRTVSYTHLTLPTIYAV